MLLSNKVYRIQRKPQQFIGHLERYVWACLYCHKKRVLDVGAKDGYGSHLLSTFAEHITIADIDMWRLDKAEAMYKFLCAADIQVVDFEKEFPKGKYDVLVAFDVIEHLENPDFFMQNVVEHLEEDGLLLFSVPHMIENEVHKVLFDEQKIKDLVGKYLKMEEFYIQDKVGISNNPAKFPVKCYIGVARKC